MQIKIRLFTFLFLLSTSFTQAQDRKERTAHYSSVPFSHLNVSAGVSTLGFTLEGATPLLQNLKVRGGINTFNFNSDQHTIDLDDSMGILHQAFGQDVSYEMKAKVENFHGHLVVDYYPFKKGILHFTGGFYFGQTKLSAHGIIVNRDGSQAQLKPGYEWPELEFDGQKLDITNGRLDAELTLGNTIKPYLGIGLGRAVSKRRLGVKFELGVLFSGNYKLKQNGISLDPTTYTSKGNNFEDTDSYMKWFKYYPMVKFQLNYRVF